MIKSGWFTELSEGMTKAEAESMPDVFVDRHGRRQSGYVTDEMLDNTSRYVRFSYNARRDEFFEE